MIHFTLQMPGSRLNWERTEVAQETLREDQWRSLQGLTFFFSDKSFHMRASRRVSSLSESSGRSSCSCLRFSSEKMNMADTGRLGFSEPP